MLLMPTQVLRWLIKCRTVSKAALRSKEIKIMLPLLVAFRRAVSFLCDNPKLDRNF